MIDGIYIFYTFYLHNYLQIEIPITASGYYARNIKNVLKIMLSRVQILLILYIIYR